MTTFEHNVNMVTYTAYAISDIYMPFYFNANNLQRQKQCIIK